MNQSMTNIQNILSNSLQNNMTTNTLNTCIANVTQNQTISLKGAKSGGNFNFVNVSQDQLTNALASTFKTATKKIGSVNISTNILYNTSSLKQLSSKLAEANYNKFISKFAQ